MVDIAEGFINITKKKYCNTKNALLMHTFTSLTMYKKFMGKLEKKGITDLIIKWTIFLNKISLYIN